MQLLRIFLTHVPVLEPVRVWSLSREKCLHQAGKRPKSVALTQYRRK